MTSSPNSTHHGNSPMKVPLDKRAPNSYRRGNSKTLTPLGRSVVQLYSSPCNLLALCSHILHHD